LSRCCWVFMRAFHQGGTPTLYRDFCLELGAHFGESAAAPEEP
jgi:hypothetical protein